MEGEKRVTAGEDQQYRSWGAMSPEIVEIGEESGGGDIDSGVNKQQQKDIYVAVGKDDLGAVKWALDHRAASPGARVFLVHIFPPITYISTPVGRLSRSQLSQEQVRFYVNEDNNKRRYLLQKYIRLCTDSKVTVETMLVESNSTAKAILDLIPILNITHLVMGAKRPPSSSGGSTISESLGKIFKSRRLVKGMGKGEFVQKNAPEFCEVTVVYGGEMLADGRRQVPSAHRRSKISRQSERNFFDCVCFSGKPDRKPVGRVVKAPSQLK